MRQLFHKLTTVSLIVAVLAGSLLSPGVRHSHSQGEVPHSHAVAVLGSDEQHGHAHDESRPSHGTHRHEPDVPASDALAALVSHCHFSVFGIVFTFPQGGENEPITQDEGQLVVLQANPNVIVSFPAPLADSVNPSSAVADCAFPIQVESAGAANSLVRPVDRILLCDSARCERSGVLLI